ESEGTYPLPEAQVDRFMMKVMVDYPNFSEEMTVVQRSLGDKPDVRRVLSIEQLHAFQRATATIYVDRLVAEHAAAPCMATPPPARAEEGPADSLLSAVLTTIQPPRIDLAHESAAS